MRRLRFYISQSAHCILWRSFFICLCVNVKRANSREGGGLRSISSALFRWDISLALNMTYFLSPIGTSCHFAYAADAPLLSLSRHFPRFIGGVYSREGELLNRVFYLSLRGSAATAAIRWNDEWSIYRALFQGDRHAYARDDTEIQLSLRGSEATKQSPGRVEVYGV